MAPSPDRIRADVDGLVVELEGLASPFTPDFAYWRDRVVQVITEVVGPTDDLTKQFDGLRWRGDVSPIQRSLAFFGNSVTAIGDAIAFDAAKANARELLKTLKWKLDRGSHLLDASTAEPAALDSTSFEPDLWDHVRVLVESKDWEKVPREAAVFVEDRLREWARPTETQGRGSAEVFRHAVSAAKFPLGGTSGEQQGWAQLFAGFALAIRNDAGHKLGNRTEAKRYALAVLGTASLLLGQIRQQYGDPPQPAGGS